MKDENEKVPAPTVATDNSEEALKVFLKHRRTNWEHEWVEDYGAINFKEFAKIWNKHLASPVEEEQERIAKSNKMRDEIIEILENFKGMRATYPLLHLFESKLKVTRKS